MIRNLINADMIASMKSGDKQTLSCLRMISSKITEEDKKLGNQIDDSAVIGVILKGIAQRKGSIEAYEKSSSQIGKELASKEQFEIEVLSKYLPKKMSISELEEKINQVYSEISNSLPLQAKRGKVLGLLNAKYKGLFEVEDAKLLIDKIVL